MIPKGKRGAGELSFCIDRDPKGSGRVCHFDVTVSDPSGNSATIVDACSAVVTDKITDKFPPDGVPKLCRKCAGGKVSECAHS